MNPKGTLKSIVIILVAIVSLSLLTAQFVMASGGKPEGGPGANCLGLEEIDVTYMPPPYTGTITVELDNNGNVYIYASLEQVGKGDCTGTIDGMLYATGMTVDEFQSLKSKNFKGLCFHQFGPPEFSCAGYPFYLEIMNLSNMTYTSDTSFTANILMMEVQQKIK